MDADDYVVVLRKVAAGTNYREGVDGRGLASCDADVGVVDGVFRAGQGQERGREHKKPEQCSAGHRSLIFIKVVSAAYYIRFLNIVRAMKEIVGQIAQYIVW